MKSQWIVLATNGVQSRLRITIVADVESLFGDPDEANAPGTEVVSLP